MSPRCRTGDGIHSWYRWYWSSKNGRYERECSILGCEAFQYLKGTMVAATPIMAAEEGKEHVHSWNPWSPIEEFHVKDNYFYDRRCRTCDATEVTESLREIGETIFFPWKEAR